MSGRWKGPPLLVTYGFGAGIGGISSSPIVTSANTFFIARITRVTARSMTGESLSRGAAVAGITGTRERSRTRARDRAKRMGIALL